MIHYTLLPEEEMKKLRWEYRLRLLVILLFFVSCALIIGTLSLLPSYVVSGTQETQAAKSALDLQKSRQARGIDQIEKDLADNQKIVNALKLDQNKVVYSDIIQAVAKYKTAQIFLQSFDLQGIESKGTTTVSVVVQGRALTREALLDFKRNLEGDVRFSQVELPISDLAKSKDITFGLRLIALH